MLISEWRDHLCRMLEKTYTDCDIVELFDVSRTTHEKIIIYLTNIIIEQGHNAFENPIAREQHNATLLLSVLGAVAVNTASFALTFAKYTLLYFFYRCAVRSQHRVGFRPCKTDFVFINSAGFVDRLVGIVEEFVAHRSYRMVYVMTSHVGKLIKRHRRQYGLVLLEPQIPGGQALLGGLILWLKSGNGFCRQVVRRLEYRSRPKRLWVVFKIMNYLHAMLIYHHWAIDMAKMLTEDNNTALFVFDIDEASKELMLSDALNQRGARTLLLQHGILTDAKRYIPTCRWMACASERERRALISVGVEPNRLFAVGQSLQTLNDSVINDNSAGLRYPLLVLAGNGPGWLQEDYVAMLRQSRNLRQASNVYLRLHPAFGVCSRKLWAKIPNFKSTPSGETLGQCLSKAGLVITFSIDALIAAVRQLRSTVCCVPEGYYVQEWHGFLYDLPGVRVARNAAMLDELIVDLGKAFSTPPELSPEESAKLDFALGTADTIKNLGAFLKNLPAGRSDDYSSNFSSNFTI